MNCVIFDVDGTLATFLFSSNALSCFRYGWSSVTARVAATQTSAVMAFPLSGAWETITPMDPPTPTEPTARTTVGVGIGVARLRTSAALSGITCGEVTRRVCMAVPRCLGACRTRHPGCVSMFDHARCPRRSRGAYYLA